jgi:protein-S-isoprenylcysteine O-methyltransferase Ste14
LDELGGNGLPRIFGASVKLIVGVVLFVGLPLLGWGITDWTSFFDHPARLFYAILIILMQAVLVAAYPDVGGGSGEGQQIVSRQRIAVLLLQVLSIAIVIAAPYSDRRNVMAIDGPEILRYLGLVLFSLGFILMNWAEISLGRQFSVQVTLQEGHQLVTRGPFRYLRHPRYLGIILFNTGIALVFQSWLALILTTTLAGVLLWRIHDEEEMMRQAFGKVWESYAGRSWRLIPFLY